MKNYEITGSRPGEHAGDLSPGSRSAASLDPAFELLSGRFRRGGPTVVSGGRRGAARRVFSQRSKPACLGVAPGMGAERIR
jgi:hypothetical protein